MLAHDCGAAGAFLTASATESERQAGAQEQALQPNTGTIAGGSEWGSKG